MSKLAKFVDLVRGWPWLVCGVLLFAVFALPALGANAGDLFVWPLCKLLIGVYIGYMASRELLRWARFHWYALALLPPSPNEPAETTDIRANHDASVVAAVLIGIALARALIVGAVVIAFALSA